MSLKVIFLADCLITQKAGIHYYAKQFIQRTIEEYPNNEYYAVLPSFYEGIDIQQIIVPINKYFPFHLRIRNFYHIPNILNKLQAHIVIEMAHFGPFRLSNKTKRITIIHDLTPILFPEWHDNISTLVHRVFLKRILKNANHLIANSLVTAEAISKYAPSASKKTIVRYPAIKIPQTDHDEQLNSHVYFLSVGTLEPRKNYNSLIKAFEIVAQTNDTVELIIIGFKGWKSNPLFKIINQSKFQDRIIIKGYVSEKELIQYYKQALAFIFPTHYEGFGLPLLEAMSLNALIVCSDIKICHEVCGENALYFNSVHELSRLMTNIIQNSKQYEKLKFGARQRADFFNKKRINLDELLQ